MIEPEEEEAQDNNSIQQAPELDGPNEHILSMLHYITRPRRFHEYSAEELAQIDDDMFYFD